MNRVRRLAEDLVNRYPTLFSGDFDKNKEALSQVTIVRTRSLRNQVAGAITKIIHEKGTEEKAEVSEKIEEPAENVPATIEERAIIEGNPLPKTSEESGTEKRAESPKIEQETQQPPFPKPSEEKIGATS